MITMDFDKFNALVESRLHYGEIDEASVVSDYKNVGCGDGYRLFFKSVRIKSPTPVIQQQVVVLALLR